MAVSIGTGNKFCLHFRIAFPNERISLDSVMKDSDYARRLLALATQGSPTPELKAACSALGQELSGGPAARAHSLKAAEEASSGASGPGWEKLAESARFAGGPIAGAMLAKFRKENPGTSLTDAKKHFAAKLGEKFISECASRGI